MDEFDLYISGLSIPEVSEKTGIAKSTLRFRFKKAGILRSRADAVRAAADKGKLGAGLRGKKRVFTEEWKENISKGKLAHGREHSESTRLTSTGYMEFTRGDHKGRLVHCVVMERRLGRRLYRDECVHHIDGNKVNNSENNLALLTTSAHARLHRREEELSGIKKERNENGTWN